jgi:hypothetical protein
MSFVPPWSDFTLPRRGKICEIDLDIVNTLADEYRNVLRARNAAMVSSKMDGNDDGTNSAEESDDANTDDEDSASDSSSSNSCSSEFSLATSLSYTDSDSDDSEYIPMDVDPPSDDSAPILRPRPPTPPSVNLGITPIPDAFTRAHLRSLGFDFIQWSE